VSDETPPREPAGLARKLALVAGGLLVGLVVAEIGLQVMGFVARQVVTRSGSGGTDAAEITILCVGDSHTYGLPLPEEESYPAQLEAALQARDPSRTIRVVNLGVPSLNSTFVANRLERQMFQLRPQLVIVWVGINNLWNVVETLQWERPDPWLPLRRSLMQLRLFRLASIAWYGATGHQYDPEGRAGWYEGEKTPSGRLPKGANGPNPAPGLARDLERMTLLTRRLEVPILFVAYPLRTQQMISQVIETAGGQLGVGVVDSSAALRRGLADGQDLEALLDRRAGPHPSGLLYGYVVEAMLPEVEDTLAAWYGPASRRPPAESP
jgi:hypothetical protein